MPLMILYNSASSPLSLLRNRKKDLAYPASLYNSTLPDPSTYSNLYYTLSMELCTSPQVLCPSTLSSTLPFRMGDPENNLECTIGDRFATSTFCFKIHYPPVIDLNYLYIIAFPISSLVYISFSSCWRKHSHNLKLMYSIWCHVMGNANQIKRPEDIIQNPSRAYRDRQHDCICEKSITKALCMTDWH